MSKKKPERLMIKQLRIDAPKVDFQDLVLDLLRWPETKNLTKIADICGCTRTRITRLRHKDVIDPGYPLGASLVALHEYIMLKYEVGGNADEDAENGS